MATFTAYNGAVPGAAALVKVSTGTAVKTMQQVATNATAVAIKLISWSFEFDSFTANTPVQCEILIHTGGPQTSLTAYNAADIAKVDAAAVAGGASTVQLGTALSGFGTGATEVTPTTVRNAETHMVSPTTGLYVQEPAGFEPFVPLSAFLRMRTTAAGSVGCYTGATWAE